MVIDIFQFFIYRYSVIFSYAILYMIYMLILHIIHIETNIIKHLSFEIPAPSSPHSITRVPIHLNIEPVIPTSYIVSISSWLAWDRWRWHSFRATVKASLGRGMPFLRDKVCERLAATPTVIVGLVRVGKFQRTPKSGCNGKRNVVGTKAGWEE